MPQVSITQSKKLAYFEKFSKTQVRYRKRHRYYWDDITRYCAYFIQEDCSVLEIGCGTGELLNGLNTKRKVGIDFSEGMIEEGRSQYSGIEFHLMSAESISLNEKFDVIILSNLISYLDDVQKVLEEVKKVSHERTKIIVTYYNFVWQPLLKLAETIGLKRKTPEQNWLSKDDVNNLLYISGFDVYRNSLRMLIPFYIPLISSFFNRFISRLPFFRLFSINQFAFARLQLSLVKEDYESKYSVSVVIPARNESGNIENAILRLPVFGRSVEIIFVEGNSTDDTWQKIQDIQEKYKHSHTIKITQQEGKGKADAVRKGFSIATGDILMILDADLTVPPEDLPKFYNAIASGKGEYINGSRLVYPMDKQAMRFLNLLGNKFFSIAFSWLLERPFKDTLCGTKVLSRKDYTKLMANRKFFGDFDPFGDFDLIFGAYKLNLKIVEVPIRYRERTYGSTNISRFKHGIILLKMCFFAARKIKFY